MRRHTIKWWNLIWLGVALVGCRPTVGPALRLPSLPTWTPPPAGAPTMVTVGVLTPISPPSRPTPTAAPSSAWQVAVAPEIPAALAEQVWQIVARTPGFTPHTDPAAPPDLTIGLTDGAPVATWIYAVVGPFPTLEDDVTLAALQARWQSADGPALALEATTAALLTRLWGSPPGAAVIVLPAEQLAQRLWQRDGAWAIVPFEQLQPAWKVLAVAGMSPLAADFTPEAYPLVWHLRASGEPAALAAWPAGLSNRDPAKLTRLAMTGVTALVRATAFAMEQNGVLYPGEEVAGVLRSADIAHISNEVAFAPDCPYPNPIGGTTFCSDDRYFELLQSVGADVIELTGNHVNDWGSENLGHTLDLYDAAGMQHFGGGRNAADAQRAAQFEHHGNRIALVGCNPVGPVYAWATADAPGSRPCDGSLAGQIAQLSAENWLVFATLQYDEFYFYAPTAQQQADFRALIDAGATAVSGSQGHHAQGFELYGNGFIHYGLGNLFFDQMDQLGTRQSFVDTYIIYDGRLISVTLFTGLIENYARPRVMTPDERREALTSVFDAGVWP